MPSVNTSFLKASNVYFVFALITLSAAVAYGVLEFRTYQGEKQAIMVNETRRQDLADAFATSQQEFEKRAQERSGTEEDFKKKLAAVLPPDESYTELTRQFDAYFQKRDLPGNGIFQSSLRFGKGTPVEGAPGISVLPISMNIDSTRDNFLKFLEFVDTSGSLESGIRLMEIKSIQLNFQEGGELLKDPRQKINFTVEMSAYHQTSRVAR